MKESRDLLEGKLYKEEENEEVSTVLPIHTFDGSVPHLQVPMY